MIVDVPNAISLGADVSIGGRRLLALVLVSAYRDDC